MGTATAESSVAAWKERIAVGKRYFGLQRLRGVDIPRRCGPAHLQAPFASVCMSIRWALDFVRNRPKLPQEMARIKSWGRKKSKE